MIKKIILLILFVLIKANDFDIKRTEIENLFISDSIKSVESKDIDIQKDNFLKDKDLQLDDMELSEVDYEIYGEYEKFLQRYYEKNFLEGSSLKQLTISIHSIVGSAIPFSLQDGGLKDKFNIGGNFGFRLDIPKTIYFGNFKLYTSTDIFFSTLSGAVKGQADYKLTNLFGMLNLDLGNFGFRTGLGLSPSSIGQDSEVLLSIPVDLTYKIKINKQINCLIVFHAQETLGWPGAKTSATSEILGIGAHIGYPITISY